MTDTQTIRITRNAAAELEFKTEVTRDDHGSPAETDPRTRCTSCGEDTPSGYCDRSRQAHEVAQQLTNGHRTKRHVVLTLTRDAVAYAAGEMDNAADIVEDNIDGADKRERMALLARSRSYRAAEAAFNTALSAFTPAAAMRCRVSSTGDNGCGRPAGHDGPCATILAKLTDNELRCAYMHGWTARSYIGHGMSDRADTQRGFIRRALDERGIDCNDLTVRWGTCDCDVPRHDVTGYPLNI